MVTDVEQLVELEILLSDGVFLDVNLESLSALLQLDEACLAHLTNSHDATGYTGNDVCGLKFFSRLRRIFADDLRGRVGKVVAPRIGFLPESFNQLQFFTAQVVCVFFECQGGSILRWLRNFPL